MKNTHKNIITVSDYGLWQSQQGEVPFYVMPYYTKTLRKWMHEGKAQQHADIVIAQLLDGVEAAHLKNVWHRDLKPENVLIDEETMTLVIADWGIAHFTESELHTLVETTPRARLANFVYAAPEQRQPGGIVDARAHIYSPGLIINELFTGAVIQGVGFKRVADIHPEHAYLDPIVETMVQQSPAARVSTIGEVKKQFLAKRMAHVSRQKLDDLHKQASSVAQPRVSSSDSSLHLIGADYRKGKIYLRLNRPVPHEWFLTCLAPILHAEMEGKGALTQLENDTVSADVSAEDAQAYIERFKNYINVANEKYAQAAPEREEKEQEKLQQEIQEEEERLRVLANLKI